MANLCSFWQHIAEGLQEDSKCWARRRLSFFNAKALLEDHLVVFHGCKPSGAAEVISCAHRASTEVHRHCLRETVAKQPEVGAFLRLELRAVTPGV